MKLDHNDSTKISKKIKVVIEFAYIVIYIFYYHIIKVSFLLYTLFTMFIENLLAKNR